MAINNRGKQNHATIRAENKTREKKKRAKLGRREDDDGLPEGSARRICPSYFNSFNKFL
jgi:hypothetical protein